MVLIQTRENNKTQYCQRHKDAERRSKPKKKSPGWIFQVIRDTLKCAAAPAGESEGGSDAAGSIVISAAASKKQIYQLKKNKSKQERRAAPPKWPSIFISAAGASGVSRISR